MAGVYVISFFTIAYYFFYGWIRFNDKKEKQSILVIGAMAILLRLFCLKQTGFQRMGVECCCVDILNGWLIYKLALTSCGRRKSLIAASFYLFNPAILFYAILWNTTIAIECTLIILCVGYLKQDKTIYACLLGCICMYFYTETILLAPLWLIAIFRSVKKQGKAGFMKMISVILLIGFLLGMADVYGFEGHWLQETMKKWIMPDYMSGNTCNLWSLIGWNWKAIGGGHFAIAMRILQGVILVGMIISMICMAYCGKEKRRELLPIGVLTTWGYVLIGIGSYTSIYIIVILLTLMHFMINNKRRHYVIYVLISIITMLNQIYANSLYSPEQFNPNEPLLIITSFMSVIGWGFTLKGLVWGKEEKKLVPQPVNLNGIKEPVGDMTKQARLGRGTKIDKKDCNSMVLLMVIFAILSIIRLGSMKAPQTAFAMKSDTTKEIVLDLGEEKNVDHLSAFLGYQGGRKVVISSYDVDQKKWEVIKPIIEESNESEEAKSEIEESRIIQSVFAWNDIEVKQKIRYLGIVAQDDECYLNELAIVDENGQLIMPIDANRYEALFDEQALYLKNPSYFDRTMFDEVYHARTAYEFIHQYTTYETTHPPLGKIIISLGIRAFGMTPFGWRIAGEIFGIIMIPLMYLFAKKCFRSSEAAMITTILLTFDFMHFTLSKIATIDIFIAFFILLMYYFMYQYCCLDLMRIPLKKSFISLGLCGISMGLGIATKWTGVYAAAGLAVLFFGHLWQVYLTVSEDRRREYYQKVVATLAFCIVFFIVIPLTIYCLSYIPLVGGREYNGLVDKAIDNMKSMYQYHSRLVATHPYESTWYQWPYMKRPLLQELTRRDDGMVCSISCMGNPLVWWPGIIAVLYVFKCWLWDKDKKAEFLSIAYSAQLIPWMFVTRCTFIYHYFPCSLFTILCLGYCLNKMRQSSKLMKNLVVVYVIGVLVTFVMFYPVISGQWHVEADAVMWLKWLDGWPIV